MGERLEFLEKLGKSCKNDVGLTPFRALRRRRFAYRQDARKLQGKVFV